MFTFQRAPKPMFLFFDRDRLSSFVPGQKVITSVEWSGALVDLEVKNYSQWEETVKKLLVENKITPRPVFILLSPGIYLEKVFPENLEDGEQQKVQFLESIPFEYVRSKIYHEPKADRIIALNRELYESLIAVLEKLGFTPAAITPLSVLPIPGMSLVIDLKLIKGLAKTPDLLKEKGLLSEESPTGQKITPKQKWWQKNRRLMVLLAVFLGFVGVFLVLLASTFSPPPAKLKTKQESPPPVIAPPAPNVPVEEVPSLAAQLEAVNIQILNGSRIAGQAEIVRRRLIEAGARNVVVGNSSVVNNNNTLILHAATISGELINTVVRAVDQVTPQPIVRETGEVGVEIIITTGNGTRGKIGP